MTEHATDEPDDYESYYPSTPPNGFTADEELEYATYYPTPTTRATSTEETSR